MSVSRVNINFCQILWEDLQDLKKPKILKEFYGFFVYKTSVNLIIPSDKFSSVLSAAVTELFNLLSLPPLMFLL